MRWRARDFRPLLLRRRASRPQLKRDPLGSGMSRTVLGLAKLVVLCCALALCTTGTSCFVASRIVLTPAPSPVAGVQSRIIAVTDSVVTRHGLKATTPWPHCTVRGVEGIPQAEWRTGSLSVAACVERTQPWRVEISVRRDAWGWNAKGNTIRQELPDALGAVLGAAVITVYPE